MKKKKVSYFDDGVRAIENMTASGIGRQGRRQLAGRLFGKGHAGWQKYKEAEKILKKD